MARPKKNTEVATTTHLNITEIVREAYANSGDSVKVATEKVYEILTKNQDFLREKLPVILRAWCNEQVRQHITTVRLVSFTTPSMDLTGRAERLRSVISAALMDFPLPGGKRLGDATGGEVAEGAAVYQEKADDAGRKARWLQRIAETVGEAKVSEKLSEDDLARLREDQTNAR